jgi:hypothetical protein
MYDYLEDILEEMPSDMNGTSPTPASDNLFDVDETSLPLNEKESDFFHRTTARLLFAAKRARPDLQGAVACLCTRVKCPSQSDYRKLARVIKYLRLTISISTTCIGMGWIGNAQMVCGRFLCGTQRHEKPYGCCTVIGTRRTNVNVFRTKD